MLEPLVVLCAFFGVSASHGVYRGCHDTRNELGTFNCSASQLYSGLRLRYDATELSGYIILLRVRNLAGEVSISFRLFGDDSLFLA